MRHGFTLVLLAVFLTGTALAAPEDVGFGGRWTTTFGPMTLTQKGKQVSGTYLMDGTPCTIAGSVEGTKLTFRYEEPGVVGEGWFELAEDGQSFTGQWREEGASAWRAWIGRRVGTAPHRTFDGLWDSSFGRMRLVQRGDGVEGIYTYGGGSTLEGRVKGRTLTFTYAEPSSDVVGEGSFALSDDAMHLVGKWRESDGDPWEPWSAQRLLPQPGVTWLVVVEARWERGLADEEYSFGAMLRTFFARSRAVRVRHRFFNDEPDLRKWCRETAYLAEPVLLCIAAHGAAGGVRVGSEVIGPRALADSLRHAGNTRLLHFSSCLMMQDDLAGRILKHARARFPISGYSTNVDWAASAIIEFLYFDLILVKNTTPGDAAKQLGILMPFSKDHEIEGSMLRPAGFKILLPPAEAAAPK